MRMMTASQASRSFSAVLDEAERGETIVITRGGRRVATIAPASAATWGRLREALRGLRADDDDTLERDVLGVREGVRLDRDPWIESA